MTAKPKGIKKKFSTRAKAEAFAERRKNEGFKTVVSSMRIGPVYVTYKR